MALAASSVPAAQLAAAKKMWKPGCIQFKSWISRKEGPNRYTSSLDTDGSAEAYWDATVGKLSAQDIAYFDKTKIRNETKRKPILFR